MSWFTSAIGQSQQIQNNLPSRDTPSPIKPLIPDSYESMHALPPSIDSSPPPLPLLTKSPSSPMDPRILPLGKNQDRYILKFFLQDMLKILFEKDYPNDPDKANSMKNQFLSKLSITNMGIIDKKDIVIQLAKATWFKNPASIFFLIEWLGGSEKEILNHNQESVLLENPHDDMIQIIHIILDQCNKEPTCGIPPCMFTIRKILNSSIAYSSSEYFDLKKLYDNIQSTVGASPDLILAQAGVSNTSILEANKSKHTVVIANLDVDKIIRSIYMQLDTIHSYQSHPVAHPNFDDHQSIQQQISKILMPALFYTKKFRFDSTILKACLRMFFCDMINNLETVPSHIATYLNEGTDNQYISEEINAFIKHILNSHGDQATGEALPESSNQILTVFAYSIKNIITDFVASKNEEIPGFEMALAQTLQSISNNPNVAQAYPVITHGLRKILTSKQNTPLAFYHYLASFAGYIVEDIDCTDVDFSKKRTKHPTRSASAKPRKVKRALQPQPGAPSSDWLNP